ncbi:protein JADE-1, partial [Trifolium medium]|nr:protein JADE-1 [Trifolium medium]
SGYRNSLIESSGANSCSSSENQQLICTDVSKADQVKMEQLDRDELEGELIYFQNRLLQKAVAKNRLTENLVYNVAKILPQEIDKTHQQRWDAVIANQYLCDLREAKKQGRKEKKHKEAQAVLAAATAAAASSSRVSSFRKDTIDESL